MSSNGSAKSVIEILLPPTTVEEQISVEPSISEWSSLMITLPETNIKRALCAEGLYSPGSGEICTNYIAQSDSAILRHPYYNYPCVHDPGIRDALLEPEDKITYPDDGQELYLALCKEMDQCPVRGFHRNLLCNYINLRYYGVNPVGIRAMAMALKRNTNVTVLDLTDNWLTEDASYHIGALLLDNACLQELCLANCRIGPTGTQYISEAINTNRSLKSLDLSGNCIGNDGIEHLANAMQRGLEITWLNLSNNKLSAKAALALAEAIDCSCKLTHFDLSHNQLYQVSSMVKLLLSLAQSEALQVLDLSWNALSGDRIAIAIKKFTLVPTLSSLDLSNNKFTHPNVLPIIANLTKANKLKTLNLSYNPLTPSDAYRVLEKMLQSQVKIKKLFLDDVWITKEFIWLLQRVLKMKSRKNATITHGGLVHAYTIEGPDPRDVVMLRAEFLGRASKKNKVDTIMFLLQMNKENKKPIEVKEFTKYVRSAKVPFDDDFINELTNTFPGPRTPKSKTIDLSSVVDYINRMWPDKKLPPTPPPEPEPVMKEKKGKGKGKRKK